MATSRRHSVSTFTPFLDHGVYSTPARPVATPSPMEAVYKEQSARLAQENKTLQEEVQALQRMLSDKDRKVPAYETALDKLQRKYTETLAQLDQEREKSYSGLALMNSRESRYTKQQRRIEELEAEVRQLRVSEAAALAMLQAERQQAASHQGQLEEALRVSRTTQHDAHTLHHDLHAAQKALNESSARVTALAQEKAGLKAAEAAARDQVASLSSELEAIRQRHQLELHDLKSRMDRRVGEAVAEERSRNESQLRSLRAALAASVGGDTVDSLQRDLDSRSLQLSAERAARARAEEELDTARRQAVTAREAAAAAQAAASDAMRAAAAATARPPQPPPHCTDVYNKGYMDGISSSAYVDECCRKDAPSIRRMRVGKGALPVDRSLDGDLIATCRRRHCLRRFNVNDNTSALCGYHPVLPSVSYDGDYYPCCGVLIKPGAPQVFCQFRPHLA